MKRIKKAIIQQILSTYSLKKTEFEELKELKVKKNIIYLGRSKIIKGYMIQVEYEQIDVLKSDVLNNSYPDKENTGRLLVTHMDPSGRIQYADIWKIENDIDTPCFVSRDTAETREKSTQYYYVEQLEKEIEQLKEAGRELIEKYTELEKKYAELERQKEKGKRKSKKKPGHPFVDKKIEKQILKDCQAGMAKVEIAKKYNVTRATVYNILSRNST